MKIIDCPYCSKLNPPSQFICLRCEASLTGLPERELDDNKISELQEIIDRSNAADFIEKLKREYGPSESYYKDERPYSLHALSDKLPFKTTHFRNKWLGALTAFVILFFLFFSDFGFSDTSLHEIVKTFAVLVFSILAYNARGHLDTDITLTDTHIKIRNQHILWADIHRMGLLKNYVTGNQFVLLEIWSQQVPEVTKIRVPDRPQLREIRQILETFSASKNIQYFSLAKDGFKFIN